MGAFRRLRAQRARFCGVMLFLAALTGCATTSTRYAWGSYEDQVYVTYVKPGALSPEMQADQLQKDREVARAANRKLPPGWHAHLAEVYYRLGRPDLAAEELAAEKAAFPESTVFVDRLVTNLANKNAPAAPVAPSAAALSEGAK